MKSPCVSLVIVVFPLALSLAAGPARAGVVLSEIHYHPPAAEGDSIEFVELHNASTLPVDLSGWRFRGEIRFTFPHGTRLEPGGYLAVCRDRTAAHARFGGPAEDFLGDYDGSLGDKGGSIELEEAYHARVDAVAYDDQLPWPERADGQGGSLQRLCLGASGEDPLNWIAALPTPAGPISEERCPPPPYTLPAVVFSEVHYHPRPSGELHPSVEDGEEEEFVELHNPGRAPFDLEGFRLEDGVSFTFPAGASIAPGAFLAVCRNQQKVRDRFGAKNVIGDWSGKLSNGSGRVALVDHAGRWIDSVHYGDSGEWPYGADGLGWSLAKIVLTASGSDPANWEASVPDSSAFRRLSGEGNLGPGLTPSFLLWLDGPGEAWVDNVLLENLAKPGENLLPNGSFDAGMEGWTASGIASGSAWAPAEGVEGSGSLRLVSSGRCPEGGCSVAGSVSVALPSGLDWKATYRVSVDYRFRKGSPFFRAGLYQGAGVEVREAATPGAADGAEQPDLPPSISHVNRFPDEPTSRDTVWISARVRSRSPLEVTLSYRAGAGEASLPMADDGQHRDGEAGDGVFGVEIPAFPHNTQVLFLIRAAGGQSAEYPRLLFAGSPLPEEYAGYYVNDRQSGQQSRSELPVHHILLPGQILLPGLPGADIEALNRYLSCETVQSGAFAFQGDLYPEVAVRFRGNTACYVKKRGLQVSFNRARLFQGLKKLNLNGMYSDKALAREHLAWELFRDIGAPALHTEYIRVHLNGEYHGLFLEVEHPDQRFLDRVGLPGGNLYKSLEPDITDPNPLGVEQQGSLEGYRRLWNGETNQDGDSADLGEFIDGMYADGNRAGGPTAPFWENGSLEEMIISYQIGTVLLNDWDSYAKNHFLYHDLSSGRWGIIPWDLDLTFGKFFDPAAIGPGRPVGTLNDVLLSDPSVAGDLNPWFGAQVSGNPLLNHLIDFFLRAGKGANQRAYLIQLWDVLEDRYRSEVFDPRLDALLASLETEEAEDHARWGRYPSNVPDHPDDMRSNVELLKNEIRLHRKFLRDDFLRSRPAIPLHPRAKITEILYLPEGDEDDREFIEFLNPDAKTLDLSGWTLPAVGYTFPTASVVPPRAVFILARSPAALRARYPDLQLPPLFGPYSGKLSNDGEELLLFDAGPGHPAVIDRVHYLSGGAWPALAPGQSLELTAAGREGDNADPASWIASAQLGGSPGMVAVRFLRGDLDGDRELDISDPIIILGYLFLGDGPPPCLEAADVDDNGIVEVNDAIRLLTHLFSGGPPPPPPFPSPGADPTPDGLGC